MNTTKESKQGTEIPTAKKALDSKCRRLKKHKKKRVP